MTPWSLVPHPLSIWGWYWRGKTTKVVVFCSEEKIGWSRNSFIDKHLQEAVFGGICILRRGGAPLDVASCCGTIMSVESGHKYLLERGGPVARLESVRI